MILRTLGQVWIEWHIALLQRLQQVAVDTCQDWCGASPCKCAKRREEESE